MHLASITLAHGEYRPRVVVVDSITSLLSMGSGLEVSSMIVRLVDFFKMNDVTLVMTSLSSGGDQIDKTSVHISSIVDTWIVLRNQELAGARFRTLSVVKARGMGHSDRTHKVVMSDKGIAIVEHAMAPPGAGGNA
jgi:circadian clock protein KaiC